jgi:hypothetical protein
MKDIDVMEVASIMGEKKDRNTIMFIGWNNFNGASVTPPNFIVVGFWLFI